MSQDETAPAKLVLLGEWMADYYCCSKEQGIQALLPAVVRNAKMGKKTHKVVRLNPDADIAGYKVHFGGDSGSYQQVINVNNVTNYSLFNLNLDEVYYVAITAYDQEGNESSYSSEVAGSYQYDTEPPSSVNHDRFHQRTTGYQYPQPTLFSSNSHALSPQPVSQIGWV